MEPERQLRKKEEYAIVLDFLQYGYADDTRPSHQKTPIVQALGKTNFTLLELVSKRGVVLQPHDDIYIGDGKRDQIHHIKGRLQFSRLTATARSELPPLIDELVLKSEKQFLEFFNKAQPLTTRMHQLELLPGLGKKHMWEIIKARKEKPFESFEDIRARVKLMPDPKTVVAKRILAELEGKEKHKIFVH
jgi:putative nucleotide binding protein